MAFTNQIHRSRRSALALALLLGAGCQNAPVEDGPPGELGLPTGMQVSVEHHFGTLLGGARLELAESGKDAVAHRVELRLLSLESLPSEGLESLAAHTRIVATPAGDVPIRGATRFAMGAGFAQGDAAVQWWESLETGAAGRSLAAAEHLGVLPSDMSSVLSLVAIEHIEDPDNFLREWPERGPVTKRLAVGVESRAGRSFGFALGFSDLAPGAPEGSTEPPAEGGRPEGDYLQHEWLVPDLALLPGAGPLLLVVPSPFASGEGAAYGIWIEVNELPAQLDATQAGALQAAVEGAESIATALEQEQSSSLDQTLAQAQLLRSYLDLDPELEPQLLRGLLLHLCVPGLGQDLGLVADDVLLASWVAGLPQPEKRTELEGQDLVWLLERAAWLRLAEMAMGSGLTLWQDALLLRHAGEVGRYPSTLAEEARRASRASEFQARMLAENRLFLEDSSASARVRAYDWLARRQAAPPGFDPLASKQARRAVLASEAGAESKL